MNEYLVSIPSKEISDMNRKELVAFLSVYLNNEFNYKKLCSTKEAKEIQIQEEAAREINKINNQYAKFKEKEANQHQYEIKHEVEALNEKLRNIKIVSSKKLFLTTSLITGTMFIIINYLIQIWERFESEQFASKVPLFDQTPETASARFRMDVVYTIANMWREYYIFLFFLLVIGIYLFVKLREETKKNRLKKAISTLEENAKMADQKRNANRDYAKEFMLKEKLQLIYDQMESLLSELESITKPSINQSIEWSNKLIKILPFTFQYDDYDTLLRLTYIYQIFEEQRASKWENAYQILREEERHQESLNMMKSCYTTLSEHLTEVEQNIGYLDHAVANNNVMTSKVLKTVENLRVLYC
ncbi:hypothetical protein [Enterococcus sp.]|uniref:hypothetical protein n=1 Tax=Enterococcus sp. TaxID=35783 RepID=UPI00289C59FD|nr:hypothetical protein [Enterococcus sp.]